MRFHDLLTRNWTLKLAALVLAVLLWTVIKAEEPTRVTIPDIPIEIVLQDPGWAMTSPPAPATATVSFSGPVRELVRLGVQRPRVLVLVDEVEDTVRLQPLRASWVQLDADLQRTRAEEIRPTSVLLFFERLTTRVLPVSVQVRGTLPPGFKFDGAPRPEPPGVRVSGPAQRLEALDSIRLQPIDLTGLMESAAVAAEVDTTGLGDLLVAPRRVEVYLPIIPIGPEVSDTMATALSAARTGPRSDPR